jgi:hypothetical protein
MNRPNGENPAGSLIYASATGSAGGPITQGVTEQGSAWRYRDWAEWHAPSVAASPKGEEGEADAPKTAQCAEFERDIDADLGAVLNAGCEPTLAQMSALMDNPLGNVAMLFTQFDLTRMDNPANNENANKYNYMGIAQFPKRLNKDWNLINRVIWNVPSMPLDQRPKKFRYWPGWHPSSSGGFAPGPDRPFRRAHDRLR